MPGQAAPHEKAKIQRYVLEGFQGGLRSEDTFSKVHIDDTECTCASNIEFWPQGTISKRNGRTYKNELEPLSGSVSYIYQWWAEEGSNFLLVFQAASATNCSAQVLYMEQATQTSASWTYILSSGQDLWNPDSDSSVVVESFGGSAIFVNGTDKMFVWNGTDTCSSIDAAPEGPVCVRGYKNYLFCGNAEPPGGGTRLNSRVWWSDPGDAHTWPAANYIDLDADDGDLITGMEILGNELIVFKERKIFAITYVGGIYEFYAENRMNGVGCAATNSIIPIFSELLFYGIENFYSFTGRDVESIGDKIKDIITYSIVPEQRSKICGLTYEEKNQVWWAVPMDDTSDSNSHILVLDYTTDAWTISAVEANTLGWLNSAADLFMKDLTLPYSDYDISWGDRLFLSNAALIVSGTLDGFILDNGTSGVTSDLGVDFEGFWRSRWLDFGMPDINKRITRMTVYLDKEVDSEENDYNLYVYIRTDWDEDTITKTETLSVFGVYPVLERRLDFTLSCRAFQVQIGSTSKGEPFTIHRIVIEYLPKGRTLVT
jgi:hypothetical protein